MKSQSIIPSKASGDASHSQASVSKLQFDFRNAKPAFLGVSYCKSDSNGMKPDSQQAEPSCGKVERNRVDVVKRGVDVGGAGAAEISSTGQHMSESAVPVGDVDSVRLDHASDAAAVQLHTCTAGTVTSSYPTDRSNIFASVPTDHTQPADGLLPDCSVPGKNVLPSNDGPLSLLISEQTESHDHPAELKPNCTENSIAKHEAGVRVSADVILKELSVRVNKVSLQEEKKPFASQSTDGNAVHSAGSGTSISSQSSLCSRSSAVSAYDDFFDNVPLSNCKGRVKKSFRSKNSRPLGAVASASITGETKCNDSKPEVVRTLKRRQRIKSESSTCKKLLLMPADAKCSNSGRSRKRRSSHLTRNIFAPKPKRKCPQSMSMAEMELPDLAMTFKSSVDDADVPGVLSSLATEVNDNTVPETTSKKWCLDITGADLTTDSDVVCQQKRTGSNNRRKSLAPDKAADRNINQLMSRYAAGSQFCRPDFSSSQETPPPSVASDSSSSGDESDQYLRSNAQDQTNPQPSNSHWLHIDTKLARYIDGRRFDRLVNGISIQIPATLTHETVDQFGQECLQLKKLTKHDLKELQNQVRVEEIYHRRAKRTVLSPPHNSFGERFKRVASRQRNVCNRLAAEFHSTSHGDVDATAETDSVNQGASFTRCGHLAAESNNDTVSYLSSDCRPNKTIEPGNFVSKPVSVSTSESLQHSNITSTSPETNYNYVISNNGTTHQETAGIRIRIQRLVCADENQLQPQDQLSERSPASVGVQQQTSTLSNIGNSQTSAVSHSPVRHDRVEDFSRQKSTKKAASLQRRSSVHRDTNKPQHTVTDAVTSGTNTFDTGAVETDESEYIAAVALASLSAALDHSQTNEERKVAEVDTDAAMVAKPAVNDVSPRYPTKPSCVSKTVQKATSVKPSKHSSDRRDVKGAERRGQHVSADQHASRSAGDSSEVSTSEPHRSRSHRSHSAKASSDEKGIMANKEKSSVTTINNSDSLCHVAIGSMNNNTKEVNIEGRRSRDRGPHTAKVDSDKKQVLPAEEKSSSTSSSRSAVKSNNRLSRVVTSNLNDKSTEFSAESQRSQGRRSHSGSSRVATASVNNNSREIGGIASDNLSEKNSCAADGKVRHRKHGSEHHHSAERKVVCHHEKKRVPGSNSAKCDAIPSRLTEVKSNHCGIDASSVRSDVPATGENARQFDNTVVASSADSSMACSSVSNQSSSSVASPGLMSPKGMAKCSDSGKRKTSFDSNETHITIESLLSSTDWGVEVQAGHNGMDKGAVSHQALSDSNRNNVSKSLQTLSVVNDKQCSYSDTAQAVSGNADTSLRKFAVPNTEAVHDTCLLTRDNDITAVVPELLQAATISAKFSAESRISAYRGSESIRSPSPTLVIVEEDEEIRSPSPCDMESPVGLGQFRVIETSWDVRLTSPCEIQSPDASDDEADDSVEQFSQHCNACFHHEPVTIPLTIKEAGGGMHHQQLDIL